MSDRIVASDPYLAGLVNQIIDDRIGEDVLAGQNAQLYGRRNRAYDKYVTERALLEPILMGGDVRIRPPRKKFMLTDAQHIDSDRAYRKIFGRGPVVLGNMDKEDLSIYDLDYNSEELKDLRGAKNIYT